MPVYDYLCPACGPFTAVRPMAAFQASCRCTCGTDAPRAILTAPALARMDPAARRATITNERSAHAPSRAQRHPPSCRCCKPGVRSAEAVPAKMFPGARPWMISH